MVAKLLRKVGLDMKFDFSNFFNDFWVPRRGIHLGQTKNSTRGKKNFSPPPPNIEKYVLPTNQTQRGLEGT